MLARGVLGSGRTHGVSFRPSLNSFGWWWLISSVFLIRISCHKTTHANGYYGAWPVWVVSISVLPLTDLSEEIAWGRNTGPSEGCNTGRSVTSNFCCNETESRKLQTPPYLWCCDSNLTRLKQPQLGPHKGRSSTAEAQLSESSPRWKWNKKKTHRRGRDMKPSVLETGTAKNKLSRKRMRLTELGKR